MSRRSPTRKEIDKNNSAEDAFLDEASVEIGDQRIPEKELEEAIKDLTPSDIFSLPSDFKSLTVEERRNWVYRFRLAGISDERVLKRIFGVSLATIKQDLLAIKRSLSKVRGDAARAVVELNDALQTHTELENALWREYYYLLTNFPGKTAKERKDILKAILSVRDSRFNLLTDVGVIDLIPRDLIKGEKKAPISVRFEMEDIKKVYERQQEERRKRDEMAKKELEVMLKDDDTGKSDITKRVKQALKKHEKAESEAGDEDSKHSYMSQIRGSA